MKTFIAAFFALCLFASGAYAEQAEMPAPSAQPSDKAAPPMPKYESAIFAGGCFWCMESDFDSVKGVVETISGYTGGTVDEPTYEQVSKGDTGHFEALMVKYDPAMVGYDELLEVYWQNVDPFDATGQFCDQGFQYRPAIFTGSSEQAEKAVASFKAKQTKLGKPLSVLVMPSGRFWYAEEHHQNYHQTNPSGYKFYRTACARDSRLEEVWGEKKGKE